MRSRYAGPLNPLYPPPSREAAVSPIGSFARCGSDGVQSSYRLAWQYELGRREVLTQVRQRRGACRMFAERCSSQESAVCIGVAPIEPPAVSVSDWRGEKPPSGQNGT